jgi:Flp pilus assembly protein TadD
MRMLISALVLIALATATSMRNKVYQDQVTLWSDVVHKSPNQSRPHNNLGMVLKEHARISEALHEFARAVELDPNNALAINNLATLYCKMGRGQECASFLEKAVSIKPDYIDARYNLAMYYYEAGLLDKALQEYSAIVQIDPASTQAAFARPMINYIQKQKAESIGLKNRHE